MARPGTSKSRLGEALEVEQHLEQGRAREVAPGLDLLDDPLDGHVLRGVGGDRRLAHPVEQARGSAGSPERSIRSGSMLRKMPISRSSSRRSRPANGEPTIRSSWPLQRERTQGEAREQHHERGGPLGRAEAAQGGRQLRRQEQDLAPSPRKVWTAGRGRSVGRSSTGRGGASRSRHAASCRAVSSSRGRERCQTAKSAILDRQLGQRRGLAGREGAVEPGQLRQEHDAGPAVPHDVVVDERERVAVRRPARTSAATRRGGRERSNRWSFAPVAIRSGLGLPPLRRQDREVDQRQRDVQSRQDRAARGGRGGPGRRCAATRAGVRTRREHGRGRARRGGR